MSPILRSGDRPELSPLDGPPRLGWIVSILSRGRHLTHRVVKLEGEKFWTRGDATLEMEGPFSPHEALGRVVGFWRDGKYHRLDRRIDDLVGLASNHAQHRLRRLLRRLPRIKRAVTDKDLGAPALSALAVRLLRLAAGRIEVACQAFGSAKKPDGGGASGGTGESWVFVARSRLGRMGEVVLACVASTDPLTGYVSSLSVIAPFRRLGVGRALLEAVEEKARGEGLGRLGALVRKDNLASRALFESRDFRVVPPGEISRRKDLLPLPAEMDLLEKML
ncbi:MAG: GNAT family N-acetyltransferase [Myxococcales bacterium]|nr:GNAT family N-acetyltransferase [Myxococcales bacterium]